jgi:predicted phosphodiesterase
MRYGVLADVHGNLHALLAAIRVLERACVDRYLCLGDLVGYGASPNECVRRVRELDALCVAGNHDLIAVGRLDEAGIGAMARTTLRWTSRVLEDDVREHLAALPLVAHPEPAIAIAHGSLDDPRRYVRTPAEAHEQLLRLRVVAPDARVLLLGHTHVAAVHGFDGSTPRWLGPRVRLPRNVPVFLNPGSVGQSRQLLPHGRVLVLDTTAWTAHVHAVRYDRDAARRALTRAGLPPHAYHANPYAPAAVARRVRRRLRRARTFV